MQVFSPIKHSPQQHQWLVHSKGVLLTSRSWGFWWTVLSLSSGLLPAIASGGCKCYNESVFAVYATNRGTLVNYSFTRISRFIFSPTTSGHWPRVSAHCCCGYPPSLASWKARVPMCQERAYRSRQRPCSEATCIITRPVESANRGRLSQQNEMCVALLDYADRSPPPPPPHFFLGKKKKPNPADKNNKWFET